MRFDRTLVGLASLAIGGCFSAAPLDLPWPPQAQSVLILRPDPPEILALERGKHHFTLDRNEAVIALFYDQPLRAYDLSYGRSEATSEPTRPLPAPILRSQGRLGATGFEWSQAPLSIIDLEAYRLPSLDLSTCLQGGQCLSLDGERCEDCTPDRPVAPRQVTTRCPWDPNLSLQQCQPKVTSPDPCPVGQRSLWDAQACEPLSDCAATPDGYPANAPTGPSVTYFKVSDQVGNGSRTQPYNSLAAAHADGSRQGTWVLGIGAFTAGLEFGADTDLEIIGVCAERTQLSSDTTTLIARGARLHLRQLGLKSTRAQALIAEDAELILSGCEIGPAIDTAITTTGGSLQISNSSLRNTRLGIAQTAGTLSIRDSTFELHQVLSSVGSSSTSIARTTMVDPDLLASPSDITALRLERCQACSISQVRISRQAGTTIYIQDANQATLFDVSIVQNLSGNPTEGIVIHGSMSDPVELDRVELSNIYIAGVAGHGIFSEALQLRGSNIFIKDNASGIVIFRRTNSMLEADLSDIYLADLEQPGLLIHGTGPGLIGPIVTIKGLTCHRSEPAEINAHSCMVARDRSTLTIDGMATTGLHWNLGLIDSSNLALSNLTGGPTKANAFDLTPNDYASIRSSRLSATPTQTIVTRRSLGLTTLEDVHIVGGKTALLTESRSHLAFSKLLIEDASTCIELKEGAVVSAMGGHLKCVGTGIRYGKYEDLVGALPGVKVDAKPAIAQSQLQ